MAADAAPARNKQSGFIDPFTLTALALGGAAVALAHLTHPNYAKIGALLGWGPNGSKIVQSAWNWSKKRGVSFPWVLATIIVESGGNPMSAGDAGGKSKGLMQVNTSAHLKELTKAGVRPEDLHKIDTGIEWGTWAMKDIYDKYVLEPLASTSRSFATPKDVMMRLAYKGPGPVANAIRSGREPKDIPWAPEAIVRWRSALAKVKAAV